MLLTYICIYIDRDGDFALKCVDMFFNAHLRMMLRDIRSRIHIAGYNRKGLCSALAVTS